eukprot:GHVN01036761.1.p1 GENE.GHVN01036761.1~~GHVN01036761.1.p1  ORF type:complete len:781 (+),score=89.00 GHVN01036761.1:152-2494(+)
MRHTSIVSCLRILVIKICFTQTQSLVTNERTLWVDQRLIRCHNKSLCHHVREDKNAVSGVLVNEIAGFNQIEGLEYELRVRAIEKASGAPPSYSLIKVVATHPLSLVDKGEDSDNDNDDEERLSVPPRNDYPPGHSTTKHDVVEGVNDSYLRQSVWRLTHLAVDAEHLEASYDGRKKEHTRNETRLMKFDSLNPATMSFDLVGVTGYDGLCGFSAKVTQRVKDRNVGVEAGVIQLTAGVVKSCPEALCVETEKEKKFFVPNCSTSTETRATQRRYGKELPHMSTNKAFQFLRVLPLMRNYRIEVLGDERMLVFSSSSDHDLARFSARQPQITLTGGWEVDYVSRRYGGPFPGVARQRSDGSLSAILPDTFVGIEFGRVDENGRGKMDGWTGCNLFLASFESGEFSTAMVLKNTTFPDEETPDDHRSPQPSYAPAIEPGIQSSDLSQFTGYIVINRTELFVMAKPCPAQPTGISRQQSSVVSIVKDVRFYTISLGVTANQGVVSLFSREREQIMWMKNDIIGDVRGARGVETLVNKMPGGGKWILVSQRDDELESLISEEGQPPITAQFREPHYDHDGNKDRDDSDGLGPIAHHLILSGSTGYRCYDSSVTLKGGDNELVVSAVKFGHVRETAQVSYSTEPVESQSRTASLDSHGATSTRLSTASHRSARSVELNLTNLNPNDPITVTAPVESAPSTGHGQLLPHTCNQIYSFDMGSTCKGQPVHRTQLTRREVKFMSLLSRVSRYVAHDGPVDRLILTDVDGRELLGFEVLNATMCSTGK